MRSSASPSGRTAPARSPGRSATATAAREPTVTDADVVLGRIDPKKFSGGKIALDGAGADARRRRADRRAARSRRRSRGARHQRNGRRKHGERRARARHRERQGCARAHPDRVRRRRAAPRRARRREARHRPCAHSGQCRASARRSGSCARPSPTRSCAAADALVRVRPGLRQSLCLPRCAPRPKRSCGAARPTPSLTSSAPPSCAIAGQGHEIAVELPVRAFTTADRADADRAVRGRLPPALQPLDPGRRCRDPELGRVARARPPKAVSPAQAAEQAGEPKPRRPPRRVRSGSRRILRHADLLARRSCARRAHPRPGGDRRRRNLDRRQRGFRRAHRPLRLY